MHFSKKSGRLSSTGSEILTFGSHCSTNFQPILDCFIPKFKLEYDDLENIKTDRVNAVFFQLTSNQTFKLFFGDTRYFILHAFSHGSFKGKLFFLHAVYCLMSEHFKNKQPEKCLPNQFLYAMTSENKEFYEWLTEK